jgi:pyridoxal phosphate enzyme (YggS family)
MNGTSDRAALLQENLARVEEDVVRACTQAGRSRQEVRLVAVTKYVDTPVIRDLVRLGVQDLGESRPQELWRKAEALNGPARWHLVGHLQRNKVERTVPLVELIHSVDSDRLLSALQQSATKLGRSVRILAEVHLSDEPTKQGFLPDELPRLPELLADKPALHLEGLMTMAALTADETQARRTFARLRQLRDQLSTTLGRPLPELSMGMTRDFPWAIAEGATLVRIGSALFTGLID